jgi:hypothetical protein
MLGIRRNLLVAALFYLRLILFGERVYQVVGATRDTCLAGEGQVLIIEHKSEKLLTDNDTVN